MERQKYIELVEDFQDTMLYRTPLGNGEYENLLITNNDVDDYCENYLTEEDLEKLTKFLLSIKPHVVSKLFNREVIQRIKDSPSDADIRLYILRLLTK